MGCTYFLLLSIKSICRHLLLLVNALLQSSGTHAWDILLFVLFIMFYPDLACLLVQINLFTFVLLVSVQINSLSCTQINFPLELIYIDVWGPSPICSKSGSKYYVSLLDAYSHYTWLYPMMNKSDVLPIFIKWQKYVEWYFNQKN